MSLYVEHGSPSGSEVDVDALLETTLADLRTAGIIEDHELVSYHEILLDPAYVHITKESNQSLAELRQLLAIQGIYSVGRYGGWTYCSIEDNILEARKLASILNAVKSAGV